MAVYLFGLDAATVASMRLAAQTPDTTANSPLDLALTEAAAEVGRAIWHAANADPNGITEADYPEDYQWCRSLVADGAVYFYTMSAQGTASEEVSRRWNGGMSELGNQPAALRFIAAQDSTTFVHTHTSDLTQTQIDQYRSRIPTPERKGWGIA